MPDRTTAKSSINFKPITSNSAVHNERLVELPYARKSLEVYNEIWSEDDVQERIKFIEDYCKSKSGRKLQKNAEPIREAVVNLHEHHQITHLLALARALEEKKNLRCFQIHIHRDEGRWVNLSSGDSIPTDTPDIIPAPHAEWIPNYHAHMVFDWQDLKTGKMLRLNKTDLSQIQDITAEVLGMERGEMRVNSNRERLEATEYKRVQEEKTLKKVQAQLQELESKKKSLPEELKKLEMLFKQLSQSLNKQKNYKAALKEKYQNLTDEQLKQQLNSNAKQLKNRGKGNNQGVGF